VLKTQGLLNLKYYHFRDNCCGSTALIYVPKGISVELYTLHILYYRRRRVKSDQVKIIIILVFLYFRNFGVVSRHTTINYVKQYNNYKVID